MTVDVSDMTWHDHQEFEAGFWGDCTNTYGEETKQITYAHRMGLRIVPGLGQWPVYDLAGKSVLDLGGGPVSMLLKTVGGERRTVVDPGRYPRWVGHRYIEAGIAYHRETAEDFVTDEEYDECWIYNVLQHVVDPLRVLQTANRSARCVRLFEWVNMPSYPGHPHSLKADWFDTLLDAPGTVEEMNENGCHGTAYYGTWTL